jgi:hypothetical protein
MCRIAKMARMRDRGLVDTVDRVDRFAAWNPEGISAPMGTAAMPSDAEAAFVAQYLRCFHPRTAAIRSGVAAGRERDAWQIGVGILRRQHVRDRVDWVLAKASASAEEVLSRLRDIAFADLAELRQALEAVVAKRPPGDSDDEPEYREPSPAEILERAERLGCSHLIKAVKRTANGTEVELHDAQRALELLARHHKLVGADVAVPLTGEIVVDLRVVKEGDKGDG